MLIALSGAGYLPDTVYCTTNHLDMLDISDIRALSRALALWLPNERNDIVPRIDSIVITTMSSTSVKAFFVCDIERN